MTDICFTDAVLSGKSQRTALLDVLGYHNAFDVRSPECLDILDPLAEREREGARAQTG